MGSGESESLFSLAEIREHSEHIAAHHGGVETIDSRVVLALVELAEAAHGIYGLPRTFLSGHYESDEVSCSCGFVSQAADYDKARKALAQHIYRAEKKILDNAATKHKRLEVALAQFDGTKE